MSRVRVLPHVRMSFSNGEIDPLLELIANILFCNRLLFYDDGSLHLNSALHTFLHSLTAVCNMNYWEMDMSLWAPWWKAITVHAAVVVLELFTPWIPIKFLWEHKRGKSSQVDTMLLTWSYLEWHNHPLTVSLYIFSSQCSHCFLTSCSNRRWVHCTYGVLTYGGKTAVSGVRGWTIAGTNWPAVLLSVSLNTDQLSPEHRGREAEETWRRPHTTARGRVVSGLLTGDERGGFHTWSDIMSSWNKTETRLWCKCNRYIVVSTFSRGYSPSLSTITHVNTLIGIFFLCTKAKALYIYCCI